jgi:hypothetical protein
MNSNKESFIANYVKRREYLNMEDSLSNLYDKYVKAEPKEEEIQEELREMIAKVHDHIEGRYELDSYDYGIIHALLCKLQ